MTTLEGQRGTPEVRIFLLGGFRVEQHGHTLPAAAWGRRAHARTLIKLLALAPAHQYHREELIELLWSGVDPDSARNSFAKTLYAARRALERNLAPRAESSYLRLRNDLLSLDPARTWIDVDHFERLATLALESGSVADHEAALAAYDGPLLPADRYEEWAVVRRDTLTARHLQLLLSLAATLERRAEHTRAIERLRQALALDPACEEAHCGLMRLYALTGSRHQAIRQYHACHAALREECGADPGEEVATLYRRLLSSERPSPEPAERRRSGAAAVPAAPPPPTLPLVGRERVLEIVLEGLEAAGRGHGELVLIRGELGVGKTRLAAEVARMARARHVTVLWGASYAQEGVVPYGPFVESLAGYLRGHQDTEWNALSTSPELRVLLHLELPGPADLPAAAASQDHQRARLLAALARLLDEIGARGPLLLVLDDLHAADEASVQALHHLARTAQERPWLIVGTYREEDVSLTSALGTLGISLSRAGQCRHINLSRLARADCARFVASLLHSTLDPSLLEHLYALSLGNPLFLQELVRMMRERETIAVVDGVWRAVHPESGVPQQVQGLVLSRVQALGETVYRALSLAAVAGMESTFALLHAAGDLEEGPLLDALDRALGARILDERQAGYVFRHPLFRAALYDHLSAHRRASLHARLAVALEAQQPDEVEALAYQYTQTDRLERAIHYVERAGERAMAVYANAAAAGYFQQLVALLKRAGLSVEGAAARERLAAVLLTLARYEEAIAVLEHAAATYSAVGDRESVGRVAARIGHVHGIGRRPLKGSEYLERVLDELQTDASAHTLAAISSSLAMTYFASGRYAAQLDAATRAARFARLSGQPGALAVAEGHRGLALIGLARFAEARPVLEAAIPLAEAAGDLSTLSGALNNLGAIYLRSGEFERHVGCLTRALELAERQGDLSGTAYFLSILGSSDLYRGDWQPARARLQRAESLGRAHPSWVTPYPLLGLGELCLGQGDWTAAAQHLEECCSLAEEYGDTQCLREAGCLLAERELLSGRPEPARARLDALLSLAERSHADVTDLLALRAWAFLGLGEPQSAERDVERSIARAREAGNRFVLVGALRIQAMVRIEQLRLQEAEGCLAEGIELARMMPYPYAEARLLCIRGLMHTQMGETACARREITAALAIFRRLGALVHVERAVEALTDLPESAATRAGTG